MFSAYTQPPPDGYRGVLTSHITLYWNWLSCIFGTDRSCFLAFSFAYQ